MSGLILPPGVAPVTQTVHPSEVAARDFMRNIPTPFHQSLFGQLAEAIERLDATANAPGAEEAAAERGGLGMLASAYEKYASGQALAGVELLGLAWFVRDCADTAIEAAADLQDAEAESEQAVKH